MNTVKFGILKEAESQLAWHSLKKNPFPFTRQFVRSNTAVILSFWIIEGYICLLYEVDSESHIATSSDCPICSRSNLRINV